MGARVRLGAPPTLAITSSGMHASRASFAPLSRNATAAAAGNSGDGGAELSRAELDALLSKYSGDAVSPTGKPSSKDLLQPKPAPKPRKAPAPQAPATAPAGNGVFSLLLLNMAVFLADNVLHLPGMSQLYLNHLHPAWYSWITHAFCHANSGHLMGNMFSLLVFGKLVEETEGAFGVVFTYLACALGAAAVSVLAQPAVSHGAVTVSLGASGAIFGLFAVAVLTRITFDPRKLLESVILGWFVVKQVAQEAAAQASGGLVIGGVAVSHVAHLAGAAAGVALVLLLRKLPADPDDA